MKSVSDMVLSGRRFQSLATASFLFLCGHTFSLWAAEGAEPLPSQLGLKEISPELRIRLWEKLHTSSINTDDQTKWDEILRRKHGDRDLKPHDEFPYVRYYARSGDLKQLIFSGNYLQVFGFLQWVLRQPERPTENELSDFSRLWHDGCG